MSGARRTARFLGVLLAGAGALHLVRPAPFDSIVPRALRQLVGMVTAESLGVKPNEVTVELGDDHGRLAVTISTSIRVVSLQRVTREPALIARTGGTILARSAASQTEIRRRVSELTGADIGRVTVRLTGVNITAERRVR